MKNLVRNSIAILALIMLNSCHSGPKSIDYGEDGCHFCRMTIVDKIHGSELITDKGKIFKFDATECMVNYMTENNELPIANLLTNYYEVPTEFIDSKEAIYLISKQIPSPMGAYLTAFKSKESAVKMLEEKGGNLYSWKELVNHLNN